MKALKVIIITLVVIVALLGVTIIGGYIYVRKAYGIDLFKTAGQLKTLSQHPDEQTLCPNAFTTDDLASAKAELDHNIKGLITYEEGKGYQGYTVNLSPTMAHTSFDDDIMFTAKEAGAIAKTVFYQQTGGKINVGDKELTVQLMQVEFLNVTAEGGADFNIVAKVDLTPFKDDMNSFPFKMFKKYVPDTMYVSSTVKITKTDNEMGYDLSSLGLKLNNLSFDDTADLFHTLDAVLKIGTAENLNMQIGTTAVNSLIGTAENPGFVYSLRYFGKTSFEFGETDEPLIAVYELK